MYQWLLGPSEKFHSGGGIPMHFAHKMQTAVGKIAPEPAIIWGRNSDSVVFFFKKEKELTNWS